MREMPPTPNGCVVEHFLGAFLPRIEIGGEMRFRLQVVANRKVVKPLGPDPGGHANDMRTGSAKDALLKSSPLLSKFARIAPN